MLTGEGVPSDDLGKDGDSYIDTNTWDFYVKVNGTWVLKGNIKADGADHDGTEGLEFYPINDTKCAVGVGRAKMLKEIIIPETYKEYTITTIVDFGFEYSKVENIVIPDSVTSIGDSAFSYCSSLKIYCEATSQPSGWDSSWNLLDYYENEYVSVYWAGQWKYDNNGNPVAI